MAATYGEAMQDYALDAGLGPGDAYEPGPTDEDLCESDGHPYVGDDGAVGRCYCGGRTYPAGGS